MPTLLNVLAIQPSHAVVGFNGFQKHAIFKAIGGPLGSPKAHIQVSGQGTLPLYELRSCCNFV
jgi:hypothetical protein